MRKQLMPFLALATAFFALICGSACSGQGNLAGLEIKSGYLPVDGGRLYYEDAGQGPCIVFLHDGMLHSEAYDPQFAVFAKDHRVVRYDRRGYGKSDIPDSQYSDIADLKNIFDSLKIGSALLIGCSAGSRLAIDFALKYPDLATGLVLLGPVVTGMGYSNHMLTRGGHLTNEIRTDSVRYRDYWMDSDPYEFYPANTEAKAKARKLLWSYPQNLNTYYYRLQLPLERSAVRNLSEIKLPTLIIVGESDIPDVHAHAGAIEAGIIGSRREVVSQAGHLVALEKPQEIIDLIRSFFIESAFFETLTRGGAAAAVSAYRMVLKKNPESTPIDENRLNTLGYENLLAGKTAEALEIFKLAVDIYPGSFNVYDSYGEALLAKGDTAQAIINYQRSLELNPNNSNADDVLGKLHKK